MYFITTAIIGLSALAYLCRKRLYNLFCIIRYETAYWIIGGAAMVDDMIYGWRNKVGDTTPRKNEVAIVTGGSRGIGVEVVKKLLQSEMHVVIGCRNIIAGEETIKKIREGGISSGSAEVLKLDTSCLESVRLFAESVIKKHNQIHILINNAGIMFVPFEVTKDGFESQLAVNYIGHFYLCHLLLPILKKTGLSSEYNTRIVNVTSCAFIMGTINFEDINYEKSLYIPSEAYAQSKLAQLMFTKSLENSLRAENARVSVFAVHPGVVDTDLFNGTTLKTYLPFLIKIFFRRPEQGSRSIVYAALSSKIEGKGGMYITNCGEMWVTPSARNIEKQDKLMHLTKNLLKIQEFGVY